MIRELKSKEQLIKWNVERKKKKEELAEKKLEQKTYMEY